MLRVRHAFRVVTKNLARRPPRPRQATTLAHLVATVPTVDHLMSVERAAQLMADRHVDALPVTKDNKVVGLFTEHDYFKKVLNDRAKATKATKAMYVGEVATMGPDLVVGRPQDTIERSLELMAKKKMRVMPVVKTDGHAMGTVSVADLAQQYYADSRKGVDKRAVVAPEVLPGIEIHDELEVAASAFTAASVFPEFTPIEDVLVAKALENTPPRLSILHLIREEFTEAEQDLLSRVKFMSLPPDYPEGCNPVERGIEVQLG